MIDTDEDYGLNKFLEIKARYPQSKKDLFTKEIILKGCSVVSELGFDTIPTIYRNDLKF